MSSLVQVHTLGRSTGPVSLVSQYSDVLGGEQVELGGSGIALVTSCPQSHCSLAWFSCVHPPAATAEVHDGAGSGPDGHGWARWGRITCHRLHSWANATGSILGTRWARWDQATVRGFHTNATGSILGTTGAGDGDGARHGPNATDVRVHGQRA